jgi:lipopolysaccharide transport system ATP-binding protein
MSIAIEVEDLSKQYRLGEVSTGTLVHDINRWWQRILGKGDPYLKISEENDHSKRGESEYIWALQGVNFQITHGEVLGIIGRNGAGKSTLLKILSRTTSPTTGFVRIKGRVASLLEVGTGFHPELTGRDNIFLNGAILGMTRNEIRRKFDEIVDFAGVERYIDTPVKRYSSGMYVRLAFGVAAHLEPEILIVDEVLAVGDAEFQKKCLGKMKDVSNKEGRTVLFVSHNMTAIKSLCNTVFHFSNGKIVDRGNASDIINKYLSHQANSSLLQAFGNPDQAPGNDKVRIKRIEICPQLDKALSPITVKTKINIEIEFWNFQDGLLINLTLFMNTLSGECVFANGTEARKLTKGLHKAVCIIPGDFLNDDIYCVSLMFVQNASNAIYFSENIVSFEVNENRLGSGWHGKWPGYIRPTLDFSFIKST